MDERPDADGFYRTVFGPSVSHNGVTYCNCNHCLRLAIRRLTAKRFPDQPGEDERMNERQREYFKKGSGSPWDKNVERVRFALADASTFTSHDEEIEDHYKDPHPKALLRRQAFEEMGANGEWSRRLFLKSVWYKLKREEIAKPGKYPRAIGDLGVAASLQGFRATELLKESMANNDVQVNGGTIRFVKTPDPTVLQDVFEKLINPPGKFYFVYFSDDSCYSIRRDDGRVDVYNVDISSCDSSHTEALFEALYEVAPFAVRDTIRRLIEQCQLPMRLQSIDREHTVLLKPCGPVLYSGSTLTTLINNLANLAIALAVTSDTNRAIEEAAASVGYVITLEKCKQPEDIQFLKCSPVATADGWKSVLNLGVLLRLSGICKGDLPGRGDVKVRAAKFQGQLLHGYMTHMRLKELDAMRRRFPIKDSDIFIKKAVEKELGNKMSTTEEFSVELSAVLKRYDLSETETADVEEFFRADLGQALGGDGLDKILKKDYGLGLVDSQGNM